MKCIFVLLCLSIGLQVLKAEDEAPVTDQGSDSTESTTVNEKEISGKNYDEEMNELEARLPSDSQSIRSNIVDSKFSCRDQEPGYYADIENECQIFHRCLEGQDRVFSFICPEQTIFSQRALVCVWNETRNFDCEDSEDFYEESNRAFSGNSTAESNINQNMKNSTEISSMEIEDVESDEMMKNVIMENIKKIEIPSSQKLEIVNEESEMVEKNSIEEKLEHVEEETVESNEFQAELIPSTFNQNVLDASVSIAASSEEPIHPEKIFLSVLEPIIEMPSEDPAQTSESTRNIRKRSGIHRNRFLFKADVQ